MTSPHISHAWGELRRPISVRSPLYAKKSGSRSTTTRSSSLSARICANRSSFGTTAPKMKAPKSAWMPIHSVAQLESRTSMSVTATTFWFSPSRFALRLAKRRTNGRTTASIAAMYASVSSVVDTAPARLVTRTIDTTNARMHHAVTSSTAAHVIAMAPSFVLSRRRSTRMRASTGNAVMLIAAPMKSVNELNGTDAGASRG